MKRYTCGLLIAITACQRGAVPQPSGPVQPPPESEPRETMAPVYARALEGDMVGALTELGRLPPAILDPKERAIRDCILRRFAGAGVAAEATDPLLAAVLDAYRSYWTRVMLDRVDATTGAEELRAALGGALTGDGAEVKATANLEAVVDAVGARLEERGLHSLRGITAPFYDFMVWRSETATTYDVELPGGATTLEVVLLRDFESLGWSAYATCDARYTGGWTAPDRLYCVADSYDLESESFHASYLAHEAQHFVDNRQFPALEQPELEYRAKLVELIGSVRTTRELVARFASQTGPSRSAPHNFANRALTRDLERMLSIGGDDHDAWRTIELDRIRRAARALFERNTELLNKRGAAVVTRVLD